MRLCDAPLGIVAPLAAGVQESARLERLVLDMDASREPVWEKVG